jgi:hypothetical protein
MIPVFPILLTAASPFVLVDDQMSPPVDEQRYLQLAEFRNENRSSHEGRKSFEAYGQDVKPVLHIEVKADHVLHTVSRLLTGACIEDVNHEIYGGIDSQMIFGESFQERASLQPKGFKAYDGTCVSVATSRTSN